MLLASSHTNEEHLRWTGLLEAKIRHLVAILERNMFIETVHVNPSNFKLRPDFFKVETADGVHYEELPNSLWFIGLKFGQISYGSINLTREIQKFTDEGTCTDQLLLFFTLRPAKHFLKKLQKISLYRMRLEMLS